MAFTLGRGVIDMHLGTQALRGEAGAMRRMLVMAGTAAGIAAAAAMTAGVVKSITTFATFEQAMARVKAITGATGAAYTALERKSLELGRTTVFTASQAAQAMGFFAQAGLSTREILDAMGPALSLAAAGQLDMATSASIVSKVMRGMKLEAGELTHVVDVLTKAFTSSNTDLIQLGEAMKFAAPVAASVGKEIEEVTAAIMAMSDAGLQGTLAGTSLRNILMKLVNPSKQAAKLMQDYNIEIKDANGALKSIADIVDEFGVALKDLGEADKLGVLSQIFEMRAATGFIQLVSVGSDRLREFGRTLEDAGGTAARIAEIQMGTLEGSFRLLKSAVQDAQIALGEQLAPTLQEITLGLAGIIALSGPATRQMGRMWAQLFKAEQIAAAMLMRRLVADTAQEMADWQVVINGLIHQFRQLRQDPAEALEDMADAMRGLRDATKGTRDELRKLHDEQVRFLGGEEQWRFIQQALLKKPTGGATQQIGGGGRGAGGIRSYGPSGTGSAGLFGDMLASLIPILMDPTKRAGAMGAGRAGLSALETAIKDLTEVIRQRMGGAEMDTTDQRKIEIDINDPTMSWDTCPVTLEGDP